MGGGFRSFALSSKTFAPLFAWPYEESKRVLNWLRNQNFVIIGGDAIQTEPEVSYSRDPSSHWHYIIANMANRDDVQLSYEKALRFIEDYHSKVPGQYLYLIMFKKVS